MFVDPTIFLIRQATVSIFFSNVPTKLQMSQQHFKFPNKLQMSQQNFKCPNTSNFPTNFKCPNKTANVTTKLQMCQQNFKWPPKIKIIQPSVSCFSLHMWIIDAQ